MVDDKRKKKRKIVEKTDKRRGSHGNTRGCLGQTRGRYDNSKGRQDKCNWVGGGADSIPW